MERKNRLALAKEICARLVRRHGARIIVCALYGSAAKGTETPWSDLEMFLVVRRGCTLRSSGFNYKDIYVSIRVITEDQLFKALRTPGFMWALWMGFFAVAKLIYGKAEKIDEWRRAGLSTPKAKFKKVVTRIVSEDGMLESYGRIFSCRERGNLRDVHLSVVEVLYEMRNCLCLLNRNWVTHDYYLGLEDTFRFKKLPGRWMELVPRLWDSRDLDEIAALSEALMRAFLELLAKEGVDVKTVDSYRELPF
jgi:kanamycin nucleotidyltransferase